MSNYTNLNRSDVIKIMTAYAIKTVDSFALLRGGSENTNYFIKSNTYEFILTICEQKTAKNALELGQLLEYLQQQQFETSIVIRTNSNKLISTWKNKPVMLKTYLEGDIIQNLSTTILRDLGFKIGQLHQIKPPVYLPKVIPYGREYFNTVSLYAKGSPFEKWLNDIQSYINPFFTNDLVKTLIHSDIFYSNVIIHNSRKSACIMDFEEAAHYYRIFDVGMALVGLCSENDRLNLKKAASLMQGYQQIIKLHEKEKLALQAFTVYAAAAMTFWRHRNFNYTNPEPKMNDHYLGLKVIADAIKTVPNHDFLNILT